MLDGDDCPAADISIDAKGRMLFPGFVDTHVHFRDPGLEYKEDFASGSEAAACGGVTTVMCMPNTNPPIASLDAFALARSQGEKKSYVDFCLQASVTATNLSQARALWGVGPSSFEINLSDGGEGAGVERVDDDGLLLEIMSITAEIRAPLGMYTGSQGITSRAIERLRAGGRHDTRAHAQARPPVAEVVGIAKALELAREADAPVVFREVTTRRAFELLRRAKLDRPPASIAVEVTPHHMLVNDEVLDRLATVAQIVPPLRSELDRRASVAAVLEGTVDFVGTDHAPHAIHEKTDDAWASRNGTPGLDTGAAVLLDFAARGVWSYPDVCRLFATAPAIAFGFGGRKGVLSIGADADLALIDPERRRTVTPSLLKSKMKRCALEGVELSGWPILTILRGCVIMEDGKLTGPPRGKFLAGLGFAGRS